MSGIQIFEPAQCGCSGGCGGGAAGFDADFEWAAQNGAKIERISPSRQPAAFAENMALQAVLARSGSDALPLTLVNGEVVLTGRYPSRDELAGWGDIFEKMTAPKGHCCGCCGG